MASFPTLIPADRLAEVFREISFTPDEPYGPHSHHRLEVNYVKRGTKLPTGNAIATVTGNYGDISAEFRILITPAGDIEIDYNAEGVPDGYLRETGLVFELNNNFASLDWKRKGYWDSYPDDAMSGNQGHRPIYNDYDQKYGEKPDQPWGADTKNFYYWSDAGTNAERPLTNWTKAMKENVFVYTLNLRIYTESTRWRKHQRMVA